MYNTALVSESMVQVYGPRSQSFENIPFELCIWFSVLICVVLCIYQTWSNNQIYQVENKLVHFGRNIRELTCLKNGFK